MLSSVENPTLSRNKKFFSLLIVFMAFFHVYKPAMISVSYGEILMIACIPLFFKQGMKLPVDLHDWGFVIFFCYMAISSMILGIVFDAPLSKYFSIARACFYWVLIFYFGKNLFNREDFEKWMTIFSVILSSMIFFQLIVYLLTGYYFSGWIPGFSINNGDSDAFAMYELFLKQAGWRGFIRPNGFLAEPSHASQFLAISIATIICSKIIAFKKKFILIAVFSSAIIITQSTTGIVLLGLTWLLFALIEKKLSFFRFPLVFLFIAFAAYVVFSNQVPNYFSIERVVNIANASEIDASSNLRLNNGIKLFSDLPFVFKIFGTGAGLSEFAFSSFGLRDTSTYMNALAGIFFSTGIIGGVIWIVSLVIMFVMSGLLGKSLVVGFFIMSLGCSIYCQPQMVWIFLLILADIKEKNDRYSRIKLQ